MTWINWSCVWAESLTLLRVWTIRQATVLTSIVSGFSQPSRLLHNPEMSSSRFSILLSFWLNESMNWLNLSKCDRSPVKIPRSSLVFIKLKAWKASVTLPAFNSDQSHLELALMLRGSLIKWPNPNSDCSFRFFKKSRKPDTSAWFLIFWSLKRPCGNVGEASFDLK